MVSSMGLVRGWVQTVENNRNDVLKKLFTMVTVDGFIGDMTAENILVILKYSGSQFNLLL